MKAEQELDLTAGKLWWEAALSELLPALSAVGNLEVTSKFQNSNTQTKWKTLMSQFNARFRYFINVLTYLKTSAAGPYSPRSSSGAMYLGSPSCMSSFTFPSPASPVVCFSSRSSPKSPSLRRPEEVMRTLAGFKSKCTKPWECKCSSADRRSHR